MLITSLFPDTPRAANALMSYNNRGVGEAIPFFEELIVPLFSNKDVNGSELMKAMISVAREKYSGKLSCLTRGLYVKEKREGADELYSSFLTYLSPSIQSIYRQSTIG